VKKPEEEKYGGNVKAAISEREAWPAEAGGVKRLMASQLAAGGVAGGEISEINQSAAKLSEAAKTGQPELNGSWAKIAGSGNVAGS
jgi:hypothetical protein